MAPGRQQPCASRKENDAGNRRMSVASSEDNPVFGSNVPFEELLARELRKSEGNDTKSAATMRGKAIKKPFLKKGARGWWMRQPGAKRKVVKHTLMSKGDEEDTEVKTAPVVQRRQQQQRGRRQSSSDSSTKTLSPVATPPQQVRTAPVPSQTLSPPASPIRRAQFNNQDKTDEEKALLRRQQNDEFAAWKNASFCSTTSTDIMGMKNVRQSYEAKQEREANEIAEFEAIERDLAAEKEAYLTEKQQQQEQSFPRVNGRDQSQTDRWGLPYSSFVSELHDQEQSRYQTAATGSLFDDSLDEEADSALVLDDHSALSKDDWMAGVNGSTNHVRDHFGYGNNYGDPLSDLSAVSFDDSVPWDDDLSFQPQQSLDPGALMNTGIATDSLHLQNQHNRADDDRLGMDKGQKVPRCGVYFVDHDDDSTCTPGYNNLDSPNRKPEGDAPVSSLVQHIFGETEQDDGFNSVSPSYQTDVESVEDISNTHAASSAPFPSPSPPVQDKSLLTLKQKLHSKHKPQISRASTSKAKGTRPAKTKSSAPPRASMKLRQGPSTIQPRTRVSPADSGMILPAVIEDKLYELEEEVKFYKSETLQLQKRKDYYDQEVKKLTLERDEFARYEQEQRVLIEKEWEQERTKMKKEAKLQERQWKLRMNATISHQDRKDRGEVDMLKAQIVKMQLDEKARASKWKAGNDIMRKRIAELEEKNRELSDEIKFLEKDRLEQWEKYERLVKEKPVASKSASKSDVSSGVLREKSQLRKVDDIFAIKETADELLKRWSFPHEEESPKDHVEKDRTFTASVGYHRHLHSSEMDGYNPKRYSLDKEDSHFSSESGAFTDENGLKHTYESGVISDADRVNTSGAAATYEWALPGAENDEALHNVGSAGQGSGVDEVNGAITTSTSSLPEHKMVAQEIEHSGGKKELLFADGSKKIIFPDGNEKDIDANGHVVIKFTNGDHKEVFPDTGISVYYYHDAQTKLTTYPDNRKVYEFPNQQIETSLPDGTTEIQFADGIKKTIYPNGDEFSAFPDGTTMLEQPDGLREVTLLNQKKIRYFPDGEMACVAPGGQEIRVRSDSELKQLMEYT